MKAVPAALRAPANNPSMTWIGHASVLVRLGGKNVLFDSIFSEYASPASFAGPKRVVPLGLKAWFNKNGITKFEELDWWQSTYDGTLKITLVPLQRWSKRALTDANQSLWGGWAVEGEGLRLIHSGDTGYSKDFQVIGRRLGPFDMAFIPIGDYEPPQWLAKLRAEKGLATGQFDVMKIGETRSLR